ncbi:hypothetical protein WDW37_15905 [Bdellovibrionota bacterium FG-1]
MGSIKQILVPGAWIFGVWSIAILGWGCGPNLIDPNVNLNSSPNVNPNVPSLPTIDAVNPGDGVVVKARASFDARSGKGSFSALTAATGAQNVSVVNSPSTSMTIDASQWVIPNISMAILDFGVLALGDLKDNNLNLCGANGTTHCGTAMIRMYTTGQAGAGMWNGVDQFGAPISAGLVGGAGASVGLNAAAAVVLQTATIAANKHVFKLADFAVAPKYDVKVDFTNAGAGTYATTIVIEFALAP